MADPNGTPPPTPGPVLPTMVLTLDPTQQVWGLGVQVNTDNRALMYAMLELAREWVLREGLKTGDSRIVRPF